MGGPIIDEVEAVLSPFVQGDRLTNQSSRRILAATRSLGEHLDALGVRGLDTTTPDAARSFIYADIQGRPPSIGTMHFRRSIVRLVFAGARALGAATREPTLDLALPPRSGIRLRPLADDEVSLCRVAAEALGPTRHAAALALAEATARTSELGSIGASDVDFDGQRVWMAGTSRTDARWGSLTSWGATHIRARLARLGQRRDDSLLVSSGRGSNETRQASSCVALIRVLDLAGLRGETDVRPASIPAWAGARSFAAGRSIEEVARELGCRSLDQAARLIGWDWTAT